ncbi:MAG TPA: DUF4439 domain-containing protein [Marmoricola sp.]|nr:DUF4439 domain-containing protein [Marmoricola sp.]
MKAVDALKAALEAEFAAVYLYGLIGGRASRGGKPVEITRINASFAAHRMRRDQLLAFLGEDAPAPAVAYIPPVDPTSLKTRTACANAIEVGCEAVYAQLVAATAGSQRAFAINALSSVSAAAIGVGQTPSAFPGLTL